MWATNLKILLTVIGTLAVYTAVANMIPQVRSAVPEEVSIDADMTPEELASVGEEIYNGIGGCTACHGLGTRAPGVLGVVGTTCAERVPDLSCQEYLHQSLVDPLAYVVEGFQPIMPDMSRTLSNAQIWALVAFLESQGGTITVNPADIGGGEAEEAAGGGEAAAAGGPGQESDPRALIRDFGCLACHQLDGEGMQIGPPFADMAGKEAEYIRRGIVEPSADTAQGYEPFAGTMPPNFAQLMTPEQIDALVRFLTGEGGASDESAASGGDSAGAGTDEDASRQGL
ncbi:MAG: c-type cytochrome [Gemmatimonadota bacterium]